MSDTYQAVYDAVRSKFTYCDTTGAFRDALDHALDFSYARQMLQEQIYAVGYELVRPAVVFRPRLSRDGNKWCALYGENLAEGIAGFGDSPREAMEAFDKAWNSKVEGLGS
jgi:hypothetical protein